MLFCYLEAPVFVPQDLNSLLSLHLRRRFLHVPHVVCKPITQAGACCYANNAPRDTTHGTPAANDATIDARARQRTRPPSSPATMRRPLIGERAGITQKPLFVTSVSCNIMHGRSGSAYATIPTTRTRTPPFAMPVSCGLILARCAKASPIFWRRTAHTGVKWVNELILQMRRYSRRRFAGLFLALIFRPGRINSRATASTATSLLQRTPDASTVGSTLRAKSQRYRADAVILLFGIVLYRRAGVGSGQVSVEETGEGDSMRRTLFFAGGSEPKRAHGLKRLGWIREVVLGPGSNPAEADYFGVLSSSPEESLEHARKSIADPPLGRSLYSAVNGRHTAGHSRSAVTHFEFASDADWSDPGLIDEARSTFQANVEWRETSWPNSTNHAPPTFLLQLATLLEQRARHAAGRYVYNEQEYLLELDASQQGGNEHLLLIRGGVRNQRTKHQTPFRLWMKDSSESILPNRIEFQPRSFLRLTFEALPGSSVQGVNRFEIKPRSAD
jgi:hypothetical protein